MSHSLGGLLCSLTSMAAVRRSVISVSLTRATVTLKLVSTKESFIFIHCIRADWYDFFKIWYLKGQVKILLYANILSINKRLCFNLSNFYSNKRSQEFSTSFEINALEARYTSTSEMRQMLTIQRHVGYLLCFSILYSFPFWLSWLEAVAVLITSFTCQPDNWDFRLFIL